MPENQALGLIQKMGVYQALHKVGGLFSNTVFRLMVGYLGGLPPECLAIIHTVEFVLSAILEVPGGIVADRIGRLRSAMVGYALLFVSIFSIFVFLQWDFFARFPVWFLSTWVGVLLGVGIPLISGSVDAFFQVKLSKLAKKHIDIKALHNQSFTQSAAFGKSLPFFTLCIAFAMVFVLHQYDIVHLAFLFGSGIYLFIFTQLFFDHQKLGEDVIPKTDLSSRDLAVDLLKAMGTKAIVLNTLGYLALVTGSYFLIALGKADLPHWQKQEVWLLLFIYAMAHGGLGHLAQGMVLPWLQRTLKSDTLYLVILSCASAFLALCSLTAYCTLPSICAVLTVTLCQGIMFTVFANALLLKARETAIRHVPSDHYAFALSILNIPGMMSLSVFLWTLSKWAEGSLTVKGFLVLSLCTAAATLLSLRLPRQRSAIKT